MIDAQTLAQDLKHFTGSTAFYRHWLPNIIFTEGIKFLIEKAQCMWLVDLIASHQPICRKDPLLQHFQVWTLKKDEKGEFNAICERDTYDPNPIIQHIEYSDFPLDEIKIWVSYSEEAKGEPVWTIYLPSEH